MPVSYPTLSFFSVAVSVTYTHSLFGKGSTQDQRRRKKKGSMAYSLSHSYFGANFVSDFNWINYADPSNGFVR